MWDDDLYDCGKDAEEYFQNRIKVYKESREQALQELQALKSRAEYKIKYIADTDKRIVLAQQALEKLKRL